jgi:hypothetical protein
MGTAFGGFLLTKEELPAMVHHRLHQGYAVCWAICDRVAKVKYIANGIVDND